MAEPDPGHPLSDPIQGRRLTIVSTNWELESPRGPSSRFVEMIHSGGYEVMSAVDSRAHAAAPKIAV